MSSAKRRKAEKNGSSSSSSEEKKEYGFSTRAIHSGQDPDPVTGAVCVPLSLATTFIQSSPGVHKGYEYSRSDNPTRKAFEQCVAACEGGKHGLAFASGSAATATVASILQTGDHVISIDDVYGGTNRYFRKVAIPVNGMDVTFTDMSSVEKLEKARKDNTKMVWLETPTNPTLKITDIEMVANFTKKHGLILVVDNTFMSPALQNPLKWGADIVLHSVSKYINGHSDVIMGVLVTNSDELNTRLRFMQNSIGAIPAPFDCYMALRGLKTLNIRMREHSKNALVLAQLFEKSDKVERVYYPGLKSHPQHDIAKKQLVGFGGMITIILKGGLEESRRFLESVKVFALAESLGAVESLVEHPAIMTHAAVPAEQRKKLGISDALIRLSVGIEDIADLTADIENALAAI